MYKMKPDSNEKFWIAQLNANIREYIKENHDENYNVNKLTKHQQEEGAHHNRKEKDEWQKHRRFFFRTGMYLECA